MSVVSSAAKRSSPPDSDPTPRILVLTPRRLAPPGVDVVADLIWDLGQLAERAVIDAAAVTVTATPDEPTRLPQGDGLLLVGGGDVAPRQYGGVEDHPAVSHVDVRRDRFELAMLADALAARVPVLALCRGMQLLNVALGGSLTPEVRQKTVRHYGPTPATVMLTHTVEVTENTELARIVGDGHHAVWSGHHQGIDRLADGLTGTAWADDGLVEAVEHESGPVIAVQWHPEFAHEPGRQPDPLFVDLAERARRHRARRGNGDRHGIDRS